MLSDIPGYVTNGTVIDPDAAPAIGFRCFATGAGEPHPYAHIREFGQPISSGGLQISGGDLLQGDCKARKKTGTLSPAQGVH
jgi:regulator of RNase E activity RraA